MSRQSRFVPFLFAGSNVDGGGGALADLFEKALLEKVQRAVERRVAFLRSRPTMTVTPELAPGCLCDPSVNWRHP